MNVRIAWTAMLGLLITTAAVAQSEGALRWFESFDRDGNGELVVAEVTETSAKQFRRIDADGDGGISPAEYVFGIPTDRADELERARRRFAIMDRDSSGAATEEEYVGFAVRVIELADANGDGAMTRDEFLASVTPQ